MPTRKSPGYPSVRHLGGKGGIPQLCPDVGGREDFWQGGDTLPGSTAEPVSSLRSPSRGTTLLLRGTPVTPLKPPRVRAVGAMHGWVLAEPSGRRASRRQGRAVDTPASVGTTSRHRYRQRGVGGTWDRDLSEPPGHLRDRRWADPILGLILRPGGDAVRGALSLLPVCPRWPPQCVERRQSGLGDARAGRRALNHVVTASEAENAANAGMGTKSPATGMGTKPPAPYKRVQGTNLGLCPPSGLQHGGLRLSANLGIARFV